jgi:hypothetical protein
VVYETWCTNETCCAYVESRSSNANNPKCMQNEYDMHIRYIESDWTCTNRVAHARANHSSFLERIDSCTSDEDEDETLQKTRGRLWVYQCNSSISSLVVCTVKCRVSRNDLRCRSTRRCYLSATPDALFTRVDFRSARDDIAEGHDFSQIRKVFEIIS